LYKNVKGGNKKKKKHHKVSQFFLVVRANTKQPLKLKLNID